MTRSDGNRRPNRPNRPDRDSVREESTAAPRGLMAKYAEFQAWAEERRSRAVVEPEHIEAGRRGMALGIDFGAAFFISMIVMMIPFVNRAVDANFVMLSLMCIRDYFYGGRGLGKNLMGLRVVDIFNGQGPGFKAVLIRNAVYTGPLLILEVLNLTSRFIPFPQLTTFISQLANPLAGLYVLVILPVECYRCYRRG
jgi:hypothetical protein